MRMLRGSRALAMTSGCAIITMCAASCNDSSEPATNAQVASATVATPTPPTGTAASSAVIENELPGDGCEQAVPTTWLEQGSIHTILMSEDPVSVQVSIEQGTICSGGSTKVNFTFTNDGASALVIEAPVIVMSGCCMDKWDLGTLDDVHIDPGGSVAISAVVAAPQVTPGQYFVGIYGLRSTGGTLLLGQPRGAVDVVSAGATLLVDASGVSGAGDQVADALEAMWASCPTSVPGSRDVDVVSASHMSAVSMTAHMSFESSAALPLSVFLGVAVMDDGHVRDWTTAAYSVNYSQAIILGADFEHLLGHIGDGRLVPCVTAEPVPFTTVTTLPLREGPDEPTSTAGAGSSQP